MKKLVYSILPLIMLSCAHNKPIELIATYDGVNRQSILYEESSLEFRLPDICEKEGILKVLFSISDIVRTEDDKVFLMVACSSLCDNKTGAMTIGHWSAAEINKSGEFEYKCNDRLSIFGKNFK